MAMLQEETMLGHFDAILHVGDFAYDMVNVNDLFSIFKTCIQYKANIKYFFVYKSRMMAKLVMHL